MRIFVLADPCEFADRLAFSLALIPKSKRKAGISVEDLPKLERHGRRRLGQKAFLHRVSYLTNTFFGI